MMSTIEVWCVFTTGRSWFQEDILLADFSSQPAEVLLQFSTSSLICCMSQRRFMVEDATFESLKAQALKKKLQVSTGASTDHESLST